MADFSSHLKQLAAMIDSECVYKEGGLILHVQLRGIRIIDELIEISLKRIPTIGFGSRPNRAFKISSVVEYVNFNKNRLSFSLSNSELFTGKNDVLKLVKFAKDSPDLESFIKVIQVVRRGNRAQ